MQEQLDILRGLGLDPLQERIMFVEGEVYKESPDHPGYWVSIEGKIIGPRGNHIALDEHYTGYYKVHLRDKKCFLHRVVMMTYKPREDGHTLVVNHKDRNRKNNHISNLEWATQLENIEHWKKDDVKRDIKDDLKTRLKARLSMLGEKIDLDQVCLVIDEL